jgi:G:T-mismatch repair DNA endonuclease (very short patch repair protein)
VDILPNYKTAIFVHGCFWDRHRGCKNCTTPTHRRAWWLKKLEDNAARDKVHQRLLRKLGWHSICGKGATLEMRVPAPQPRALPCFDFAEAGKHNIPRV